MAQNLTNFDLKELNAAIQSRQLAEVRVGENTGIPVNETMVIKISADIILRARFVNGFCGISVNDNRQYI